ncbi:uncharacterized protein si:dkey-282h22.5 [Dunckerocampus dactyliophorus]|uniref:uncharacterized protein si:dkey-282h22.5 n=1 Tax=Dunckerocampus dactyliophorus TaxID=161453 RepID=UPI002406CEB1|nr:uncharacterized protein si:dkey-282h22.5 [Dunckerocampus dactyliophorus]
MSAAKLFGTITWNIQEDKMHIRIAVLLLCMVPMVTSQEWQNERPQWYRTEHTGVKACSNLTQILDNWKFAIVTQVKDLLINDHVNVLPEYSRIRPLSDALGDLYRQFSALKEELASLTVKLDSVEAFADRIKDGSFTPSLWLVRRRPLRAQMRPLDPIRVRRPERPPRRP